MSKTVMAGSSLPAGKQHLFALDRGVTLTVTPSMNGKDCDLPYGGWMEIVVGEHTIYLRDEAIETLRTALALLDKKVSKKRRK